MRAIKTTTISILAIGLLAGTAVGVAAQDEEGTTEPSTPAIVTGWARQGGDVTQTGTEAEVDGVIQSRGFVREGDPLEMDDPRLTGSVSTMWSSDRYTAGDVGAALVTVSKRIENEEGSWSGSCTSSLLYVPPRDDSSYIEFCLLTGADAYDGLSAYLVQEITGTPNSPVEGLIFEGGLPPMPEMPSAE